jgi:signal transduction histidine kinase
MLEQIEHLIDGVRNATNVVAHDLRTPLAELRTRLETLIGTRPPPAETYDELQDAVGDIDRIVNIFNALLRLAEIDSGVRRAGFRRVELAGVTTELTELYEPLAEEKHVAMTVVAPEGIAVRGDPDLLAQAIGNLVDNAIKYTPCGGKVELRVASDVKDQVSVAVTDTGPGIADVDKARVTERFYRGNRASGTEGIGLGLSVVDAVTRLHGGSLAFHDIGPGLEVILTLPRDAD